MPVHYIFYERILYLMKYISKSAEETIELGKKYAESLKFGDVIGLNGDLGSGKTQFVKGIGEYFQVKDKINSPTFIIVNEYEAFNPASGSKFKLNHFDLYRLKNIHELIEIGFENYLNETSICLIEWSKLAEEFLRGDIKKVNFNYGDSEIERIIETEE